VQPKIREVQQTYKHFHSEVFNVHGIFMPELWDSYDKKGKLCQIAMSNNFFYWTILFLWFAAIINELRTIENFFQNIYRMPCCTQGGQMMLWEGEGKLSIVALTTHARCLLFALVCLPKAVISMFLLFLGAQWLSATTSFEDLVMNTVAMEFVIHIDELLYETFLPASYKKQVQDIDFFIKDIPRTDDELRRTECISFAWSIGYLTVGMLGVFLYTALFQNVLPDGVSDVQFHCKSYIDSQTPICTSSWWWRTNIVETCYPYGQHNSSHVQPESL